jgi:hypothetical protein
MSGTPKSSNASLVVGLSAAVALALGVGFLVYRQPASAPPPVPLPSPSSAAEATPAPRAADAAPGGMPSAETPTTGSVKPVKPVATQPPAGKPADKASPGGLRGTSGAPPPLTSQAMIRRSFVASRTSSENLKGGASKPLSGFDGKKGKDVNVKRAPEVDGRIEFSSTPQRVRPGDTYKIRVAFVNEGKRTIEIRELVLTTKLNGKQTREAVRPLAREVASRQNEVLYEISGTWDKSTATWSVQAEILSNHLDAYRNQIVWK